ncbi:toprim domain-containing protein [Azotobacter beijerinckii]|uniref:toprim domain-containing protein n=1 Tax=Azotobacter beijerinckii TaxID=170623 RepID=UPI0029532A32|nr:toprim domain-containing protein [Azotobacter beijerinckii]MDV7211074.1 toprim domain-containing protein [Azotobacter beijerinckii]
MADVRTVDAIRTVAAVALQHADRLVAELLPEGKRKGAEWWARNPTRGDRNAGSFSVSLQSGRWHDFASGDSGGDLVSLAAYLWGARQLDAARDLARRLGLDVLGDHPHDSAASEQHRRRLAHARAETERRSQREAASKLTRQQRAAMLAAQLWESAGLADPRHPYLARKDVEPHDLRQSGDVLLVPLRTAAGELVNLQRIRPDGEKRFLPGGAVLGAFHLLGEVRPGGLLYVCEGWATGATLHEQYEGAGAVACAMNAGNLRPVALALRGHYGHAVELVIAGDDDRQTEGNPGHTAADAAALAAGALVTFPDWPPGAPPELSDFNDLHTWEAAHDA